MRFFAGVVVGLILGALATVVIGCYFGVLTVRIDGKAKTIVVDESSVSSTK